MTRPVLLVPVSVRIAAAAAALLALALVLACGDAEEQFAPAPTTASASPSVTEAPSATPTPEPPTTTPTLTPGQIIAGLPGGYEFSYPSSWNQVRVSDSDPYIVKFFLSATPRLEKEELDELAVFVYANPQQRSLQEFFNGQERPNFFADAVGGYREFSVGGATGYWFDNVLGFTNSTVVVLSSDGLVYQFDDPQKHQSDGLFSQIVLSFDRVEG